MPITVADLVAVLRLDTSQHDPIIARSTQLTDAQTAAIRRLAEQARASNVGVLTRELQALIAAGNPDFLKRFAEAFGLVTTEAAKAGAAISVLDQALLRIAAGGRVSKLGDIPQKLLDEALLVRSRGQQIAAEELGFGVSAGRNVAARMRATRENMEGFQDLAAYWNDADLQQERMREFWSRVVARGGPGLPPPIRPFDPLMGGPMLPPLGSTLKDIRQRVTPIDPGTGPTAASQQIAEAVQAAILARDVPFAARGAGGDPSAILRALGPTTFLAGARGVSGAASTAALAEQAGIFKFLEGSTAAAAKAREVGNAAREMSGHFSTARMAGFQLGMSLLFTLEPALGRAATQIVGSTIIAFGMLPKPLAIATSSIVALAAGFGELIERMAEGENRAARFAIAMEDLDLGATRGETDKARAASVTRDRALRSPWGPFSFNVFKSNVDELFDLLAGRGTKRAQLGESLEVERFVQSQLLPSKVLRLQSQESGVRQRTSDALAQSAMAQGDLDGFRHYTEESIKLIEKRRAATIAAVEMEAGQERNRQVARDANNQAALREIELKKNLAVLDANEEAKIATLQKREAMEQQVNNRLAERAKLAAQAAQSEAQADSAKLSALEARLILEKQFEAAIRVGAQRELLNIRAAAENALKGIEIEESRLPMNEREARAPAFERQRAAVRAQNEADVNAALDRERTKLRDYNLQKFEFVEQYASAARAAEANLASARLLAEHRAVEAARAASAERVRIMREEAERKIRDIERSQFDAPARAEAKREVRDTLVADVEREEVEQAERDKKFAAARANFIEGFAVKAIQAEAAVARARAELTGDSVAAAKAETATRVAVIQAELQSTLRAIATSGMQWSDMERARVAAARVASAQIIEARLQESQRGFGIIEAGAGAAGAFERVGVKAPQTLQGLSAALQAQREAVSVFQGIKQAQEFGLILPDEAKTALQEYAEAAGKAFESIQRQFRGDGAVSRLFDQMIARLQKGGLEGVFDGLKAQIEKVGASAQQATSPLGEFDALLKRINESANSLTGALDALSGAMGGESRPSPKPVAKGQEPQASTVVTYKLPDNVSSFPDFSAPAEVG